MQEAHESRCDVVELGGYQFGLEVDKKWDCRESKTDEDLQSEPLNQIGVDTEADSCREEGDSLLPFSINEVRQSNDAGENSDKEG